MLLVLTALALVMAGCGGKKIKDDKKAEPMGKTMEAVAGMETMAPPMRPKEPARPKVDEAKLKALVKDLDDRSKAKAAAAQLAKMGKVGAAQLGLYMVRQYEEVRKAPKAKKWDKLVTLQEAMKACAIP